ncbi:MAG: hypothetical protein WB696_30325 [Chthoniobacterales bacterium]
MEEQIFTCPLSANETWCIQNPKPFLFDQELVKMDNSIQQFSWGQRIGALTQIYLAFGLPLQTALRAAEADLGQLGVQKIR